MRTQTIAALTAAAVLNLTVPYQSAHAVEPTTTALAVKALVTAASAALGGKIVQPCRVVWRHTAITVFGRRIASSHLPQLHCNG